MTDKNAIANTPTTTPRRTLGIRRQTPKSASLPTSTATPIVDKSTTPLNPTDRLTTNTQTQYQKTENKNSYATPIIPKQKISGESTSTSTVGRMKKSKIGKKLNLSPESSPKRAKASAQPQKETIVDVQSEIKRIEAKIEVLKMHDERKRQLNDSIDQWKTCALNALQELQQKIEPKQSFEMILDHLRIPHEMFDINSLED